jgi:hypothetical protein
MPIDRDIFFAKVREKPFGGSLTQQQVDGMSAILTAWEADYELVNSDLRWLANPLAQTAHETGMKMWPIEEYGKGSGMEYGKPDPTTGQTYYGRGYIQMTWRENYARADKELGLVDENSCEWHAENALDPDIAAQCLFEGMVEGWYRKSGSPATPNNLAKYFSGSKNDTFNAREIINGDKNVVPSWSNGKSIGQLIVNYHDAFMDALTAAYYEGVPEPEPVDNEVVVEVVAPPGIKVRIIVNGEEA